MDTNIRNLPQINMNNNIPLPYLSQLTSIKAQTELLNKKWSMSLILLETHFFINKLFFYVEETGITQNSFGRSAKKHSLPVIKKILIQADSKNADYVDKRRIRPQKSLVDLPKIFNSTLYIPHVSYTCGFFAAGLSQPLFIATYGYKLDISLN